MRLLTLLLLLTFTAPLAAKDFPAAGRLFFGINRIDPDTANASITADGLEKFEQLPTFGAEVTIHTRWKVDFGFRYTKHLGTVDEDPENASTNYEASINQDFVSIVLRADIIKTDLLRFDVFAMAGGANTKFEIKTASQGGEFSRDENATLVTTYGASVSVGFKRIYFFAEFGIENNKVDKLKKSGTVNQINELDLSGPYIVAGLLFDGIGASKK